MLKKIFAAIFLLITCTCCYAQLISGKIKDAKTNETLPYVNVGIVGKGVGTVTNIDGDFKLSLTGHESDSLRISMLGYRAQSFLIADLQKRSGVLSISLDPNNIQLKQVNIGNRKYKESILGNTTKSQSVRAGFTSNYLGNEIGTIIKIKRAPTYLKQFNASINENMSDSVMLRLNIYSVKDGLPDKNILQQNIFIKIHKGDDHISVDLTPYHIIVDDKFFIGVEWVKDSSGHGLKFSASFLSGAIISRETSQAKWEKIGIAGVGFNVLAEY